VNDDEFRNEELGRMAAEIEQAGKDMRRYRRMDFWTPYPKQLQFFATGRQFRERGLFAGTQLGKTEALAYEIACHLTGLYPPDWAGRKYPGPIKAWAVGENLKMVRDIMQKKLCGEPGNVDAFGSGMIPKHLFVGDPILARGEGHAYDTIQVKHKSGGISTIRFRTYQAGRVALQGETLDLAWLDEEPAEYEVYAECLARITATGGMLMIGFTPLRGMSEISIRYREQFSPDRTFVQMGIDDIPTGDGGPGGGSGHIPLALRQSIIDGYPEHEREARARGEPKLGEGKVYKTPESEIIEDADPTSFPLHWTWGGAMDLGIDHPWAYVLMSWDRDQDVIHLVAELRMSDATVAGHVGAIRALEKRIFGKHMDFRVAWPADAGTRDRGSGEPVRNLYKQFGLRMMAEPATHPGMKGKEATSLEGGVAEIDARERAGKWRVARGMLHYFQERRLYHRKAGEIVRLTDDTLAAARYGMMMRRYFKTLDESGGVAGPAAWSDTIRNRRQGQEPGGIAQGVNFDLFG
jgi:phage terminase large subunit-like protein